MFSLVSFIFFIVFILVQYTNWFIVPYFFKQSKSFSLIFAGFLSLFFKSKSFFLVRRLALLLFGSKFRDLFEYCLVVTPKANFNSCNGFRTNCRSCIFKGYHSRVVYIRLFFLIIYFWWLFVKILFEVLYFLCNF